MQEKDFQPLELNYFKEMVRRESARFNLHSFATDGETSFTLCLALSAAIKKIFFEKSELTFSNEPSIEKKPVTRFLQRMRVDAMEKFDSVTVFSVLYLAADQEDIERQQYMLTLSVYLEQSYLPEFMRLLQYPYIDSDDEMEVKDGCGTLVNLIAGHYKKEMALLGYKDLMMSPFESHIKTAPDGVGIPKGSTTKYEISFELDGVKRLVAEILTLDTLPRLKTREKRAPRK